MRSISLLSCLLVTGLLCGAGQPGGAAAADKSDYKVGDRLPQSAAPGAATATYKEMNWDGLVPADWSPARALGGLDLNTLSDSDPRATKALEQMREAWNNAPIVSSLNGARVRIPGFVVPLEGSRGQVSEFLLVPYFGACIHTPPPPSNQIIHVVALKPLKLEQIIDAVWVSGVLETTRTETGMGSAGYKMKAEVVVPYRKP